jgi:hypothetical protein
MSRTAPDWEQRVRRRPAPDEVADLIRTHGWEAAEERWSWLGHRSLLLILNKARRMDPDQVPEDYDVPDLEP